MILWQRILHWLWTKLTRRPPMRTIYTAEVPDEPLRQTVYLIGEERHLWIAALRCPCGCGELLQMSLMPEGHPRWQAVTHWNGTTSLHPSVWRQKGCRSHFFLCRGRVIWCDKRTPAP
jgi:hypothetical protein